MSILGRQVPGSVVAFVAVVLVVGALLPVMTKTQPVDREITLVTHNMRFYVDGDRTNPNPVIEVKRGERVRIVLKNTERGMTHDFAVPAFGAKTSLIDWNEQDDMTFTAPAEPGTYEYICNPHLLMMKGLIKVV
jgi:plastocyanin